MEITFVTESHAINDDKATVDVALHSEVERLKSHTDNRIGQTKQCIDRVERKVDCIANRDEGLERHAGNLEKELPVLLAQILKQEFSDKIDCFAKTVEKLKLERSEVSKQLQEIQRARSAAVEQLQQIERERDRAFALVSELREKQKELLVQMSGLRDQVSEFCRDLKGEFSKRSAELQESVPVPKPFAKFLFASNN